MDSFDEFVCDAMNEWNNVCRRPLLEKCYSEEKAKHLKAQDSKKYEKLQERIRVFYPNFNFQSNCHHN